jgi:dihydroorotate dehydrogenase (fumarate)
MGGPGGLKLCLTSGAWYRRWSKCKGKGARLGQFTGLYRPDLSAASILFAIKLCPFFSNLANLAKRLDEERADGLVLFNRFYQPDSDLEELEIKPNVLLSTPQALRLPLTWIGILYGKIRASMAATSGVHSPKTC